MSDVKSWNHHHHQSKTIKKYLSVNVSYSSLPWTMWATPHYPEQCELLLTTLNNVSYSLPSTIWATPHYPEQCELLLTTINNVSYSSPPWTMWATPHYPGQYLLFFGVHPLRMTTTSSSTLKVGFAVAEEANAWVALSATMWALMNRIGNWA